MTSWAETGSPACSTVRVFSKSAALDELAYALDVLRLDGVALPSNAGGTYLGDPAWNPLFDELDRRGAYVFVHPNWPPYEPPLGGYPIWLHEFPFDTTRAVVNLLYSGTLERCPNLRLQLAHLGGTVPFIAHRVASLLGPPPISIQGSGKDDLLRRFPRPIVVISEAGKLFAVGRGRRSENAGCAQTLATLPGPRPRRAATRSTPLGATRSHPSRSQAAPRRRRPAEAASRCPPP